MKLLFYYIMMRICWIAEDIRDFFTRKKWDGLYYPSSKWEDLYFIEKSKEDKK